MKTLTEFKKQHIQEDGHTDVPSAMRSLKVMTESISEIETALSSMSGEDSLESWWMNKINSAKERLEAAANYIKYPMKEETEISEDVINMLRTISKKKKEMNIKFASGTEVPIDPDSANVLLKTYDSLNSSNKKKMQMNMNKDTKSFMKVLDFAFSNAK